RRVVASARGVVGAWVRRDGFFFSGRSPGENGPGERAPQRIGARPWRGTARGRGGWGAREGGPPRGRGQTPGPGRARRARGGRRGGRWGGGAGGGGGGGRQRARGASVRGEAGFCRPASVGWTPLIKRGEGGGPDIGRARERGRGARSELGAG